ncbi:MAG: tetraacyldisaccharide 4'-kinase [Pseudomonadota bacterium]
MKAPGFWWRPPGVGAALLAPLSCLWKIGARVRAQRLHPVKAPVPVLCIGNLTAGGGGKTPMAMACLARLAARGVAAHLVSRGHGGRLTGPHRVDPARDASSDVGDEPLLLASLAPVWIARDRAAGVFAAAEAGADLVVLDDGFQNPGLVKDAAILMVDAGQGFGNGRVIPAGPLREPVAQGLARADLIVLVGRPETRARAISAWPVLAEALGAEMVAPPTGLDLAGQKVIAFAGIARPAKFFETLRGQGADLLRTEEFADHAPFSPRVLDRLVREARRLDALLVTTEKDAVRLPPAFSREVMALPVRLEPLDWAPIDRILAQLAAKPPQPDR